MPKADFLIEVSWEVCNKVGGIYTVIESKVDEIIKQYASNYLLIGPYLNQNPSMFSEKAPPQELEPVFNELKKIGIVCHYGKWSIFGEPKVVLIDSINYTYLANNIKAELWNEFKIDSLGTNFYDFDQPIVWGYAVGKFIEAYSKVLDKKIAVQFHEWLSASALLYLKKNNVRVAKIFTTHATVLGRALSTENIEIYNNIKLIDPLKESQKRNIQAKVLTEKAAALNSDIFTTISEITGLECQYFLGKKPDLLLPNGLNLEKYPTSEEAAIKHQLYREKIREFLLYYFFPYYTFVLEHTLVFFISGRYEFHNKGIDLLIEALAKLNNKLKEENSQRTIVVFFWIPSSVVRIKPDIIENKAYYEDIKNSIDENFPDVKHRITRSLISRTNVTLADLFLKDIVFEIENKISKFIKSGMPSLCTHDLYNENDDAILNALRLVNLTNKKEDKVKVVFYPIYLSGADHLLDLNYRDAMMGTHIGVFPSYYEPWGYTPLETAALGVASITTDLGGFGQFLNSKHSQHKNPGIFVLSMLNKNKEQRIDEIYNTLYYFANLSREERIKNKIESKNLASLVDWKKIIRYYIKAHDRAVEKVYE